MARRRGSVGPVSAGRGGAVAVGFGEWVQAARPRTLPLAVAPVAAATGLALMLNVFSLPLTLLALFTALFLQLGVNFANDYSDGVRGTDRYRKGPARLTASGRVDAKRVRSVAFAMFGLAALAGVLAVVLSGRWWFLAVGAAAVAAAWFYTGGKRPYGYAGFGEVFVFVFFGVVATAGTLWLQTDGQALETWFASAGVGFFAVAVLIANNVRDIEGDRAAGKRTLAVIIGDLPSRILYTVMVVLPFGVPLYYAWAHPGLNLVWFTGLLVVPGVVLMLTGESVRELVSALQLTSFAALAYGVLLGVGFAL